MSILAILTAFTSALEQLEIKYSLTRLKIGVKHFNVAFFPVILAVGLFFAPFDWFLDWHAFSTPRVLGELGLLWALGAVWHLTYLTAVKREHVEEYELFRLLQPLVATVLASIFFISERNWNIILAVGISSVILVVSHIQHKHLHWSRTTPALAIGIGAMGAEAVVVRDLLHWASPAALLIMYSAGLTLIFRYTLPRFSPRTAPELYAVVVGGVLAAGFGLLLYSSLEILGVGRTLMYLLLETLLVYLGARVFLHEKFHPQKLIAGILVSIIVIWASLS